MKNTKTSIAPSIAFRKYLLRLLVLAGFVLGFSQAQAQAEPIFVPNASFESPALPDGEAIIDSVPGWTFTGSGTRQTGIYNPNDAGFPGATSGNLPAPALGPQSAFLHTGGPAGISIRTTPLTTILPNTTYTLTVAIGVRLDFPFAPGAAPGFAYLNLFADGQPFNSLSQTDITVSTIGRGTFVDFTTSFTTGATGGVIGQGLYPIIGYFHDGHAGVSVDNVRLTCSSTGCGNDRLFANGFEGSLVSAQPIGATAAPPVQAWSPPPTR